MKQSYFIELGLNQLAGKFYSQTGKMHFTGNNQIAIKMKAQINKPS
jgi:hypothetical protein